jgi:hypothetical protein
VALSAGRSRSQPPAAKRCGAGFWVLLLFFLGWSAVALLFDAWIIQGLVRQLGTQAYTAVEGVVLRCKVKEETDGDGTSYSVDIKYRYQVGGHDYTGTRVRYLPVWDRASSARFVEAHPPGSQITVFHAPADPADAVLLKGSDGAEVFLSLLMMPFNTFMLAMWCGALIYFWFGGLALSQWSLGIRFIDRDGDVRVRLPRAPAVIVTLVTLAFGPIPVGIVVALCAGPSPPAVMIVCAWAVVLGGAAAVYLASARWAALGKCDLVIDRVRNTVTLPQTFGRKKAIVVPLADVLAVEVVQGKDKEGDATFTPTLRWRDAGGEERAGQLADGNDREFSEYLTDWVRTKAGLVAPTGAC